MLKSRIKNYLKNAFGVIANPKIQEVKIDVLRKVSRLITASNINHSTFSEYKGCNAGKSVVLVGAGPSVNKFQPLDNCIYVGLNRACLIDKIHFDYLFTIDKSGVDKIYSEFGQYDCVKFVGDQNLGPAFQIPESEVLKWNNVKRYITDAGLDVPSKYSLHIDSEPLGNFNSVSLQAMQFILYTNPAKIYLVGIDCSASGHFNQKQDTTEEHAKRMKNRGEDLFQWADDTQHFWYELKKYADQYYPDTQIISVNPVGLRGLFKDLDQ